MMVCGSRSTCYTPRDALIGAGVMLGATLIFTLLGLAAKRGGWTATGEILLSFAFPVSLTMSMPFWMMKGQPRTAQVVIVGGTLTVLVAIACLAQLL